MTHGEELEHQERGRSFTTIKGASDFFDPL